MPIYLNIWYVSDRLYMCHSVAKKYCLQDCTNAKDGVYALCTDCRKYLVCHDEHTEVKSCPDKAYWGFDTTERQCRYKSPDCYECDGMLQTMPVM